LKTIVWDVDDVLNELMYHWFEECYKNEHADLTLTFNELVKNPPHDILRISKEDYLSSLDTYRISEKGRNLAPNKDILDWFYINGSEYRHIALTSRSRKTIPILSEWVFRHYGDWIRTLSFIPAKRPLENVPVYDVKKADFLVWLEKVDLYIDDMEENIKAAKKVGINSLLYPRPWNSSSLTVKQFFKKVSILLKGAN
jgi:FMN phosphatase YigB (HAD superfamily)